MATHYLDARGQPCPLPLLKTKLHLQQLAAGDRLEVMASDPGARRDIPAFVAQKDLEMLSIREQTDPEQGWSIQFVIRKRD